MATARYQRSLKRYDCFVSFHGGERLADLGFFGSGMEGTVRDLAKNVRECLLVFGGRHPSVFYRDTEIEGRIPDELAQALLQLRGGGLGLVLLSLEFLRREDCLAELRAFLELEKLQNDDHRSGEAIEIRLVCLEDIYEFESVRNALNDPALKDFFSGLNPGELKLHSVAHDGMRHTVVNEICDHVRKYWRGKRNLCLGKDRPTCLAYLQQFPLPALSLIASKLELNLQSSSTLDTIFSQALERGKLTDSNLKALLQVTSDESGKNVLSSFGRKWIDEWRWGIRPGENEFCFRSLIEEAAAALRMERGTASSTRIDPPTTPSSSEPSASQPTNPQHHDCFRPYFPDGQRLSKGLESNAATSLAQLKAAILPANFGYGSVIGSDPGNQESDVGLCHVAMKSVAGEGGVGKTSTCKLLCADENVRAHFAGGALVWIDVGPGATEEKVKGQVRSAMWKCGGRDLARDICVDTSVDEAVGIASDFFSQHRILLVIDNVWETPVGSSLLSWAASLSEIASCPGSVVIMTTRSRALSDSERFDPFHLGRLDLETDNSPGWPIAEQLYDALLQATPEEQSDDDYKIYRRKGLRLSCGSLLGIKTFAGLVRHRMQIGGNVESLLEKIDEKVLGLAARSVGKDLKASIGHRGLFAAMEESLAHLDEHKGDRVESAPPTERKDGEGKDVRHFCANYDRHVDKPLSSRYAALEVMPESSTRLSFPILCRLWHVATVAAAEEIALSFVDIGLGSITGGGAEREKELVLHDLQYEFCVSLSKGWAGAIAGAGGGSPGPVGGHALLLSSCETLVGSVVPPDGPGSEWASFCFREGSGLPDRHLRRYLAQNLFRHLSAAAAQEICGVVQTILNVLSQFQWIRGRICADGRIAILADCSSAEAALRCHRANADLRASNVSSGGLQLLRLLCDRLMLATDGVSMMSDGTLAASLFQLAQSFACSRGASPNDIVIANRLAASVERHVRGPWLKPVNGCSRVYSSDRRVIAKAVVGDKSPVLSVAALGDGEHIVSGSLDGVARVHECLYLETVVELTGHCNKVTCVSAAARERNKRTFAVFSGSDDKSVRFWDARVHAKGSVNEVCRGIVGKCEKEISCLAVSKSGTRVAAGCWNGDIFIWKRASEGGSPSYEVLTGFASPSDPGHNWVTGVALSWSGDLVVAGGCFGNVAVWTKQNDAADGAWEEIRSSDESSLVGVSLSNDEKSVHIFFSCPSSVEIWDVHSRSSCSSRPAVPDFETVQFAISSGSTYAMEGATGSSCPFLVRGDDENRDNLAFEYCLNETLEVLSKYVLSSAALFVCLASTALSKRVVVGCDDGCVRMVEATRPAASESEEFWKESERLLEGGKLFAPEASLGDVACVAVLPVSGRVVAGHTDGCFSLWRVGDGSFEREFRDERGNYVHCIDVSGDESVAVSAHGGGMCPRLGGRSVELSPRVGRPFWSCCLCDHFGRQMANCDC